MNALRAAATKEVVEASTFTEGQVVETRHGGGGRYYPGKIGRDNGDGTYDVDYDDGDKEQGVKADLIKKGSITAAMVDAAKDVEAEAEVEAEKRRASNDRGLAAAAADTTVESNLDSVRDSARSSTGGAEATVDAPFREGQPVECRHGGGAKYYPGKVARDNRDGTYDVDYDDGDKEQGVKADLIRSVAAESPASPRRETAAPAPKPVPRPEVTYEEDQRIECRHGGKAKFYLGRVARVYPDWTYDVDYDDGDKESRVDGALVRAMSEKAVEKERAQEDAEFEERAKGPRQGDYVDEYDDEGARQRRRRRSPERRKKPAFKPKPRQPFKSYPDRSDVSVPSTLQERTNFLANRSVLKMAQRDTPTRELRRLVKEEGGDLFETDAHEWTALMWAVSEANVDMVEALLALWRDAGEASDDEAADSAKNWLDSKDRINGWTALHLAAIGGTRNHFSCAKLLVRARAKLDVKDACLDEPLDCISVSGGEAARAWRGLLGKGDAEMETPRSPVASVAESPRDRDRGSARGSARRDDRPSARGSAQGGDRRDGRDSRDGRDGRDGPGSGRASARRETPRSSRRY